MKLSPHVPVSGLSVKNLTTFFPCYSSSKY
jgi:hypothetical protein